MVMYLQILLALSWPAVTLYALYAGFKKCDAYLNPPYRDDLDKLTKKLGELETEIFTMSARVNALTLDRGFE